MPFPCFFLWKEGKLQYPGGKGPQIQRFFYNRLYWWSKATEPPSTTHLQTLKPNAHLVRIFLKFSPVVRLHFHQQPNGEKLKQTFLQTRTSQGKSTNRLHDRERAERCGASVGERFHCWATGTPLPSHVPLGRSKSQKKNFENCGQSQNDSSRDRKEVQRDHWKHKWTKFEGKNQSSNCNGLIRMSRQIVQKCMVTFPFSVTCLGPMAKILKKNQDFDWLTSGLCHPCLCDTMGSWLLPAIEHSTDWY